MKKLNLLIAVISMIIALTACDGAKYTYVEEKITTDTAEVKRAEIEAAIQKDTQENWKETWAFLKANPAYMIIPGVLILAILGAGAFVMTQGLWKGYEGDYQKTTSQAAVIHQEAEAQKVANKRAETAAEPKVGMDGNGLPVVAALDLPNVVAVPGGFLGDTAIVSKESGLMIDEIPGLLKQFTEQPDVALALIAAHVEAEKAKYAMQAQIGSTQALAAALTQLYLSLPKGEEGEHLKGVSLVDFIAQMKNSLPFLGKGSDTPQPQSKQPGRVEIIPNPNYRD